MSGMMTEPDRFELGLAIAEALAVPGQRWTVDELAGLCGCHRNTIINIESKALQKLARAIRRQGLTLEDLIPDTATYGVRKAAESSDAN